MEAMELVNLLWVPVVLGLFGFIEPCTIGASLLFLKSIEGERWRIKVAHTLTFMVVRGGFIGLLGIAAALMGSVFIGFQKGGWFVLGAAYVILGLIFLAGKGGGLMKALGPSFARLTGAKGSAALGLLFGLNIPACAAPLVFALLGQTAVAAEGDVFIGFITLGMFGVALSLPIAVAVLVPPVARGLDRLSGLSARLPRVTGLLFAALGAWSLYFALFVQLENWK